MDINLRQYQAEDDQRVSDFLIENSKPGNQDGNWLQPAWEYMHFHPSLDESALGRIGIWEDAGKIVGVAHYESSLGEAFFQVHADDAHLKPTMLEYAEDNFCGKCRDGITRLRAYVNDFDQELEAHVRVKGYEIDEREVRPLFERILPQSFPEIVLPGGFRLKSLADENNLAQVDRVLWRGFNHEGEPPEDGIERRKKQQTSPNLREDLTLVVMEPGANFVSFCGMWYESVNRIAYVEPVATDPDYRRLGLAKAAVLEGIRRCRVLGAAAAYVGSDLEFCKVLGFRKRFNSRCWVRRF